MPFNLLPVVCLVGARCDLRRGGLVCVSTSVFRPTAVSFCDKKIESAME